MAPVISSAADLIRNINAGNSFELTANNEIKTQGFFAKLWQNIGDKLWRSTDQINARQSQLDAAMADMLRGAESLPNLTQQNLLDAAYTLPKSLEQTLSNISTRLNISEFPRGTKPIAVTILKKTGDVEMAKSVETWKDSDQIPEKDMQKFSGQIKDDMNNYMMEQFKQEENFKDGVSNQLIKDAERQIITVGDQTYIGRDGDTRAIDAFKKNIQEPEARRFVSSLMCQTGLTTISNVLNNGTFPDGKGFVPQGLPKSNESFLIAGGSSTSSAEYSTNITLQTSGGVPGNPEKATITLTQKIPVQFTDSDSSKPEDVIMGNVNVTLVQECTLGKNPSISDFKVKISYEGPKGSILDNANRPPVLNRLPDNFTQQLGQQLNTVVKG